MFVSSVEHRLMVSGLSSPSANTLAVVIPKNHTVFNSDMYVPPIRGSLIREKKACTPRYMTTDKTWPKFVLASGKNYTHVVGCLHKYEQCDSRRLKYFTER